MRLSKEVFGQSMRIFTKIGFFLSKQLHKSCRNLFAIALNKINTLAQSLNSHSDISAAYLSLGNTFRAKGNLIRERKSDIKYEYFPWRWELNPLPDEAQKEYEEAEKNYKEAVKKSSSSATKIQAQLNLLSLILETSQHRCARKLAERIDIQGQCTQELAENIQRLADNIELSNLPPSRTKVYAQINLARNLAYLRQILADDNVQISNLPPSRTKSYSQIDLAGNLVYLRRPTNISTNLPSWGEIDELLAQAALVAENIQDNRAQSYALGNQGGLYEYFSWFYQQMQQDRKSQEWRQKAQQLTQKALYLAQPSDAPEIAYQWQWQLGRLLETQEEEEKAIAGKLFLLRSLINPN